MRFIAILALALAGCSGTQKYSPSELAPTPDQLTCIALAEIEKERTYATCGSNVEGACATDSIQETRRFAGCVCFLSAKYGAEGAAQRCSK